MIEIRVYGTPAPQGSKKFVGIHRGRGIMVESSKKVKPWRQDVKAAALDALEKDSLSIERHCNGAIPGAVSLEIIFTLQKPKSAPKNRKTWPDKKPDLPNLLAKRTGKNVGGRYNARLQARSHACRSR